MGRWSCNRGIVAFLAGCVVLSAAGASAGPAEPPRARALDLAWAQFDAGEADSAREDFVQLLRERTTDLAAAEGIVALDCSRCRPEEFLHLAEGSVWAPGRTDSPAVPVFVAGVRKQTVRNHHEALADFEQAAELALGTRDTLSALGALRLAGFSCLRAGEAEAAARVAARMGSLVDAQGVGERQRLNVEILRAGSLNLSSQLVRADSVYSIVISRAEASGLSWLLAQGLNGRGSIASKQRRPSISLPLFQRAEQIVRRLGDGPRLTMILKNAGYDHTQARDTDAALLCYEEARTLAEECHLPEFLGYIYTGFGAVAEVLGDREAAIRYFTDSYQAHAGAGELRGELGARQRLAYDLMISGRYTEATTQYGRCLEMIEERDNDYLLNWVLGGLALTHHKLGQLDQAEHYYLRAKEVNEALGDRMSVAWCHLSLGWLEMQRGDYRRALLRSHEALEIYRELDDSEGIGDANAVMAEVHFTLGDWDEARNHFEIAAAIGERYRLGELLNRAYHGLGEVCSAAGQPGKAQAYCRRALQLARDWSDANGIIWALLELASQAVADGQLEVARQHLAEATARLDPEAHIEFRARARLLQARCAERTPDAEAWASEALKLARDGGRAELEWSALSDLGQYRLAMGDSVGAFRAQSEAIEVVESLRRAVGADELRRHMMRPALLPYERMVHLCLGGGNRARRAVELALATTERSRAQILAARLQSTGAAGPGGGSARAGTRERELLASIAYVQSRLQHADLQDAERQGLRDQVARFEEQVRYLRIEKGHRDPGFRSNGQEPFDPVATLAEGEEAISYFLGERESYLFHITAGGVEPVPLPARGLIEERVRHYLSLRSGPTVPPEILDGAERTLYEILLGPIASQLGPEAVLIVVPDGILHRLPFATLRSAQGYLIEDHELFVTPSLRSLASLRNREKSRRATNGPPALSLLAVGCGEAETNGDSVARRVHPFDQSPVASLRGATREAQQVAGLFDRAMVLTGRAACEANFKRASLEQAEVLHIAAHSYADERDVRRSYVLMNSMRDAPDTTAIEDDLLQWSEVAALHLNASLVTLASCRSAGGVLAVGEGVTGLTQAFLFAGGTCVLASQSDIGDEYSRRFMLSFYEHLRRGESASRALRRVQLQWARDRSPESRREPWADFVLIGDGSVTLSTAGGGILTPLEAGLLVSAVVLCISLPLISIVRRRRSA